MRKGLIGIDTYIHIYCVVDGWAAAAVVIANFCSFHVCMLASERPLVWEISASFTTYFDECFAFASHNIQSPPPRKNTRKKLKHIYNKQFSHIFATKKSNNHTHTHTHPKNKIKKKKDSKTNKNWQETVEIYSIQQTESFVFHKVFVCVHKF